MAARQTDPGASSRVPVAPPRSGLLMYRLHVRAAGGRRGCILWITSRGVARPWSARAAHCGSRGRHDPVEPERTPGRRHRLALPERTQALAEGVSPRCPRMSARGYRRAFEVAAEYGCFAGATQCQLLSLLLQLHAGQQTSPGRERDGKVDPIRTSRQRRVRRRSPTIAGSPSETSMRAPEGPRLVHGAFLGLRTMQSCHSDSRMNSQLECAPGAGQDQAAGLTVCRAW